MTQSLAVGGFLVALLGVLLTIVTLRRSAEKDRAELADRRRREVADAVTSAVAQCNSEHERVEAGLRDSIARIERDAAASIAAITKEHDYQRGRSDQLQDRLDEVLGRIAAPGVLAPPPPRDGSDHA